mgnify:CR=1 FL=1|tara:strand:- start:5553 stop:5966 length:414 start_codon:yes stop_codon:yes gene_type:complete
MSKQIRRLEKKKAAAAFLENHTGPVMSMLAEVVEDLAEETEGMRQFDADLSLALELGHRLDEAVTFPDPVLEALDGVVASFVALVAIGIYRAACRAEKLRGAKLDRLRDRLESRGPKMAKFARRHLERRIKKIEAAS